MLKTLFLFYRFNTKIRNTQAVMKSPDNITYIDKLTRLAFRKPTLDVSPCSRITSADIPRALAITPWEA